MIALALAAQAAPAATPYPVDAVYAAFTQGCSAVGDLEQARRALAAAGWEEFTPPVDSPLGGLLAKGKAALQGKMKLRQGYSFRRTVAGEALELTLSGIESDGQWVNGCRMYDFNETRPIPVAAMTAKLGREPGTVRDVPNALAKAEWEPGYMAGHSSIELYHVPAASPLTKLLGAPGNCMVAQATGALK